MPFGVVEVGMTPAPGHHGGQLREIEAPLLELAAKVIQVTNFEIEAHSLAGNRCACGGLVQSNSPVASGRAQPCIYGPALVTEILDELESQPVTVKVHPALHVF